MQFLKNLFGIFKPRYHLALDSNIYDKKTKKFYYRFKIYGSHGFLKFNFHEINKNKNIVFDINPYDLMKIALNELKFSEKSELFEIAEVIRDNKYKISNLESEQVIFGEDLCGNSPLIEKIKNMDIYKIAYNTGFNNGRKFSKSILNQSKKDSETNKPNLKIVRFHKTLN
jgi:hypothetical protein